MSHLGDRFTDYTAADQVGEEAGIIEVFPRNLLKSTIGALDRASVKVPNVDVGLKEIKIVVIEDCRLLKEHVGVRGHLTDLSRPAIAAQTPSPEPENETFQQRKV